MKTKLLFFLVLSIGLFATGRYIFSQSKPQVKTLTILYSNNMNGEIDPCPT